MTTDWRADLRADGITVMNGGDCAALDEAEEQRRADWRERLQMAYDRGYQDGLKAAKANGLPGPDGYYIDGNEMSCNLCGEAAGTHLCPAPVLDGIKE